jgi:hypothetical protein
MEKSRRARRCSLNGWLQKAGAAPSAAPGFSRYSITKSLSSVRWFLVTKQPARSCSLHLSPSDNFLSILWLTTTCLSTVHTFPFPPLL